MAIHIDATRTALADAYQQLAMFCGLASDDSPGDAPPTQEASGGGYSRVALDWLPDSAGVLTAECSISVGPGTYTHAILCRDQDTAITNDDALVDYSAIDGGITLNNDGQVVLTVAYKQS